MWEKGRRRKCRKQKTTKDGRNKPKCISNHDKEADLTFLLKGRFSDF